MSGKAVFRETMSGRMVSVVGDLYRFLATGDETDSRYASFEALVPPGGGPPPHRHSREQESFYVLQGEITFRFGDECRVAKAGTAINMPPGLAHSFKNESAQPARMLISVAPAGLEQMFFECGVAMPEGSTNAAAVTPDQIAKLLEIAPNYGIEILVPAH